MVDMFFERMKEDGAPIGSAFGMADGCRRAILPMHQHTNHFPVHPEIIKKMIHKNGQPMVVLQDQMMLKK